MKNNPIFQFGIAFLVLMLNFYSANSQEQNLLQNIRFNYKVITTDIDNFWEAYDSLQFASDSISIIQKLYLDKASEGLTEFLKVRPMFTSKSYVEAIRNYGKFWKSVRENTLSIKKDSTKINDAFLEIKQIYPQFEVPDICFVISPLGTGGTSTEDNKMLLIGTEIVAADSNVDVSEFQNILKDILGTLDVPLYIIHESIHTAQNPECESGILSETLREGSAEFISHFILKRQFRTEKYEYGYENECVLWKELKVDIEIGNESNYSKWFGSYNINKHPDMGYFLGYRIIESYYKLADNKEEALVNIIKLNNPMEMLDLANYQGNCNN